MSNHMREKKKQQETTPEQSALEQQVDAMMDPKVPDSSPDAVAAEAKLGPTTAPELTPKLRKKISVSHEAAPKPPEADGIAAAEVPTSPLQIEKLEDLSEDDAETAGISPEEPVVADQTNDDMAASTELDDSRTDEAVADIVAHEGDVMLALQDATTAKRNQQAAADEHQNKHSWSGLFWFLVVAIIAFAAVLVWLFLTGGNVSG